MANATDERNSANQPRPAPHQVAWQDLELGLIYHFDMPVYLPEGWEWNPAHQTTLDPNAYNPTRLDTDQWLEAAKEMGARYAVFTATHMGGFLQWQSDLYPYGVKQTRWRDGKADVVRDFVASCRRAGVKPGLYLSTRFNAWWEVSGTQVNFGKGDDREKQAQYVRTCEKMVEEICSRYGELVEIWFDGGVMTPDKGGPDVLPVVEKHQPNIIFYSSAQRIDKRWAGNEDGVTGRPCWATMPKTRDWYHGGDLRFLGTGDPGGELWCPAMADAPLRGSAGKHEWFWRPNDEDAVYSLDDLVDRYERSVGRNANLIIGMTPDRDGLVPEVDMRRCREFGEAVRRRYGNPVAETKGNGETLELAPPKPSRIDRAVVMEDITHGERVREYAIEGLVPGGQWREICRGESIGHKRIERFEPIEASKVRLRVARSIAPPRIRSFAVFRAGQAS